MAITRFRTTAAAKRAASAKKPAKTALTAKRSVGKDAVAKTPAKMVAVATVSGKKAPTARTPVKTAAVAKTSAKKFTTARTSAAKRRRNTTTEEVRSPRRNYFPFMELLGEIRNMIYRNLLIMLGIICINGDQHRPEYREDVVVRRPTWGLRDHITNRRFLSINQTRVRRLLETSKQIYVEAAWFYYGCNHFYFSSLSILYNFLQAIRPDFHRHITHMSLIYSDRFVMKAIKLLRGCVSLERLQLMFDDFIMCDRRMRTYSRLRNMAGLKDLLQLRGLREVTVDTHLVDSVPVYATSLADKDYIVNALQVLTQPHDPIKLRRQFKKDYPDQVSQRTTSGKVKDVTSAKRKTEAKSRKSQMG